MLAVWECEEMWNLDSENKGMKSLEKPFYCHFFDLAYELSEVNG